MLRARQGQRILQKLALGPLGSITIGQHVHVYIAVSQRGRLLNRLGDTAQRVLTDHDAIDHDLDIVLELLVQIDRIVERAHFTVDTHAAKALGAKVLKQWCTRLFARAPPVPAQTRGGPPPPPRPCRQPGRSSGAQ